MSPESTEQQASLGQVLASARKDANLTIEAVADRLKLSPKHITKLEQDDYTSLGPITFVKGYIKAYCTLLQLDQAQTLALFQAPESVAENKSMQSFSRRTEKEANDSRLMLVSYVILAIVLGSSGFMYWQTTSNENDVIVPEVQSTEPESEASVTENSEENDTPSEAVLTTEGAVEPTVEKAETDKPVLDVVEAEQAPVEEISSTPDLNTIVMHFKDDSWVEIFDASSERIAFGVKKAGYTMTVQGVAPFSVVLGRHQQVDVELDGQSVDLSSLPRNRSAKFKLPLSE
ncbi:RodZ domain-containing protein [Pseudoalteromonas sp. MTN2-4]|uniref:RodZ domain-containing protein n=1 Tax=Pseudoalteromonas sp. MTN2-4 TaxID=3056555 RepID=UPI0036F32D6B